MSRPIAILFLLLASVFAGCSDEDDPATDPTDQDPVLVTDPKDYAYTDDPDRANRDHLHDYWNGLDALVVVDATEYTSKYVFEDASEIAAFRPEAGQTIPLGTASVTVTVDWEDVLPGRYGTVSLWVKTAATDAAAFVADLTPGTPVEVSSTNDDNDLPHQVLSGWMFVVMAETATPDGPVKPVHFEGEVTMLAQAHRGLDIPLFPGHPDHWENQTHLDLRDTHREVRIHMDLGGGNACLDPCLEPITPRDGAIVPPGTAYVLLNLTYDDDTMPRLYFEHHAADTWEWTRLEPVAADGNTDRYRIDVEGGMADGPYAKQSLWAIQPYTAARYPGAHAEADQAAFWGAFGVEMAAVRTP